MIQLKYDRVQNSTLVFVNDLSMIGTNTVRIEFKNIITNEIHYTTNLSSNMWTSWSGAELITDVLVYSENNELLKEFKWDVTINGDEIEKILWFYLLNRKNKGLSSNGLVIGTHDGRNGHWIYPIKDNLSKATLIEGGKTQFEKLKKNYIQYNNVEMINKIVTPDGGDVCWYEGGEGYTDTVIPGLINDWLDISEISKSMKSSISINEIFDSKKYDWLHLDVEGIDDKLIMALKYRPNVIVYESMNLSEEETAQLDSWFNENSYKKIVDNGNTIAIKNFNNEFVQFN
jgi:hypothetical protein